MKDKLNNILNIGDKVVRADYSAFGSPELRIGKVKNLVCEDFGEFFVSILENKSSITCSTKELIKL